MAREPDHRIADVVARERSRLLQFIRRRVADPGDAEDILQDVFAALVETNQLLMPIEHVTGWLFRVARNRIIDLFRRRKPEPLEFEDLLPSPDAGPDALFERRVLLEKLEDAIAPPPPHPRAVFIPHQLERRSFKENAAQTRRNVEQPLSP